MFTTEASNEVEANVLEVLDSVDLDIAHTPVIEAPGSTRPLKAHATVGGEYYIVEFPNGPGRVSAERLRRMRARFLCTRGWYVRNWHLLPESEKLRMATVLELDFADLVNTFMRRRGEEG